LVNDFISRLGFFDSGKTRGLFLFKKKTFLDKNGNYFCVLKMAKIYLAFPCLAFQGFSQ